MKSSIKEEREVQVLSEELLSDNALLQYRKTSENEVSVVIRYIKSSSIKEVTLFKSYLFISSLFLTLFCCLGYFLPSTKGVSTFCFALKALALFLGIIIPLSS